MEILIVMTLIGILATLTFTLGEGVRERGKVSQARVELAILATALESFKSRYGDYPQTGGTAAAGPDVSTAVLVANAESHLFNALTGVIDPALETLKNADGNPAFGKVFIEGARFTFESRDADGEAVFPETAGTEVANAFLDPWGRRYQYFYRSKTDITSPYTWTHPGFVLYSAGPDGVDTPPTNAGDPQYAAANNIDNLYAGRN